MREGAGGERIVVVPDGGGDRLDRALAAHFGISRGEARRLLDAGGVYVDGRRCRVASRAVAAGTRLLIRLDAVDVARRALDAALVPAWVHRDADLGVLDKPQGMPVQATRSSVHGTIEAFLRAEGLREAALHHRLDREARGLVAVALSRRANAGLARAFSQRVAVRRYRALVDGAPATEEGTWEHVLVRDGETLRAEALGPGEPMRSTFRVVESRDGGSLIEVTLDTGRTHQVRLQCAAAGCPVRGDARYGRPDPAGLHLQAFALALPHPVSGEPLGWELPPAF